MILVVCLNPALDITHQVASVDWSGVNRAHLVLDRPGGKGTNVARILHSFGISVSLTGLAGGATGAAVSAGLDRLGVPTAFTPIAGETRRTFSVVDDSMVGGRGQVALFNEPGPEVSRAEFARFRRDYDNALAGASVVVLSGSLPPGLPADSYAGLIAAAAKSGVPAVLDTSGDALRSGLSAGPAIVKPNLDELGSLTGAGSAPPGSAPLRAALRSAAGEIDLAAVTMAAAELRADGADAVVASLGPDGLLAVTGGGCWRARVTVVADGNATGAGDAVTAALAHGLLVGRPWPQRLRHAAALGSAAVMSAAAGEFSAVDYQARLRTATVSSVPPTSPGPLTPPATRVSSAPPDERGTR